MAVGAMDGLNGVPMATLFALAIQLRRFAQRDVASLFSRFVVAPVYHQLVLHRLMLLLRIFRNTTMNFLARWDVH